MIKIKEIESYKDFGRVLSISNGKIEAYITIDIGPRIIRFGFVDGQNIMQDDRKCFGTDGKEAFVKFFGEGRQWENFGGHRIWASPESYPETYYPDSRPVKYEMNDNAVTFTPPAETETGLHKILTVKMDEENAGMSVTMSIKNISNSDKEYSVWGLSVCNKGGTVIIPMNTNDTGVLSNRIISVWPYTDMSDKRIYWGKKYVTVAQAVAEKPIKLGFDLNCGTVYYVLGEEVFVKKYDTKHPDAKYPDGGCSFETYTNSDFIEVESLGELKNVKPNEVLSHTENWTLLKKPCDIDFKNDSSIEEFLNKL